MAWRQRIILLIPLMVLSALVAINSSLFVREIWTRKEPLLKPIAVEKVHDGHIVLVDGRVFRPTGVARNASITPREYDQALRVATSQGVQVVKSFSDGTAVFLAEPKFYNWCGTHSGWTHWAGTYVQCGLSECLVFTGYASPAFEGTTLTKLEQWRIEGTAAYLCQDYQTHPFPISKSQSAFRFDSNSRFLAASELDCFLSMWRPPPY